MYLPWLTVALTINYSILRNNLKKLIIFTNELLCYKGRYINCIN